MVKSAFPRSASKAVVVAPMGSGSSAGCILRVDRSPDANVQR